MITMGGNDKQIHTNDNKVYRTDDNFEGWQAKFGAQIDTKCVYRVPLEHFCDLGKINFPTKIDKKVSCTLQTEMKKPFESKKSNDNWSTRRSYCICQAFLYSILANFAHAKF